MKLNWKTTLAGVVGAVLIVAAQAFISGKVSVETVFIAGAVAAIGALAGDANVEQLFKSNAIANQVLDIGDGALAKIAASNPNNAILQALAKSVDDLHAKVDAMPDAVAAAVPPAIVSTLEESAPAQAAAETEKPALIPIPDGAKFDPNTGEAIAAKA